jgi:hypothetical protein
MSKSLFSNVNWKNPSLILSYKQQDKSSIELILIKNLLNSEFAINIQNVIKYWKF